MSESERDDSSLLACWVRQGCERSFRLLVDRYAGLVYQAAKRGSGDDSIAAEASQATFILLARKARALTGRSSLAGWLHVTAVHQSRNLQRRQMRETRKRQRLGEQPETTDDGAWLHIQPELDRALAALSSPDRETLLLRYYRSLSVKEIAVSLGVSVEAAQKRLTRATERLRERLTRRGCVLPVTAIAAGLVTMAGDAKAASALAPGFASKALATAAAATPFASLTSLVFATKKTVLMAAAVALLGAGTYVTLRSNGTSRAATTSAGASSGADRATAALDHAGSRIARERPAATVWPDLAKKYGESRTNLSRHVVDGFLQVLDEMIVLGEATRQGEGAGDALPGKTAVDRQTEALHLTDSQKEATRKLLVDHEQRRMEQARAIAAALRKEPRKLVEMVLAGDARTRNQISQADYEAVADDAEQDVEKAAGVSNLDLNLELNGTGDPLQDNPGLRSAFTALLDPAQAEAFRALAERDRAAEDETETDPPADRMLPAMELEKLDQALVSTRMMMTGVKQVLDGIKHLPAGLKPLR